MIIVTGQTRSGTRLDIRLPAVQVQDETLDRAARQGVASRPEPQPGDGDFPSAAQVQAAGTLASRAWRMQCRTEGGLVVGGVAFHQVDRVTFEPEAVFTLFNIPTSLAEH